MKKQFAFVSGISLAIGLAGHCSAAILDVHDVWCRPASDATVLYATITNTGDRSDRLDRVVAPVAVNVTLHESVQSTMSSDMPGMKTMSVMSMKELRNIQIPAHHTVRLAPGGYHAMLGGIKNGLKVGRTFPVRFHFVHAGWRTATAHVR